MRTSGILYPISSLPSRFGIGSLSKEAYAFVDFLHDAGQRYWQILPICPTGFGDSPYLPYSGFAGNPYSIDLEAMIDAGFLSTDEVSGVDFGSDETKVDYGAIYRNRFDVLRIAYGRFKEQGVRTYNEYTAFIKKESYWLQDYALYNALKNAHDGAPWYEWETPLKMRDELAIERFEQSNTDEIGMYYFSQFAFRRQWNRLRARAQEKQVEIIGDIPFYVNYDSADVWAHPELFQLEEDCTTSLVAGCAPDRFAREGQIWGAPLYHWERMKEDGYEWWINRIRRSYTFFDVLRMSYFRGFSTYYALPFSEEDPSKGKEYRGPGMPFFEALKEALGPVRVIADDFGALSEEDRELVRRCGFPGIRILQDGFEDRDSSHITHRHEKNSVVYTGTHDHIPLRGWIDKVSDEVRDFTRHYINSVHTDYNCLTWDLIREAYRSHADICIVPLQDYLVLGKEAQISHPGTRGGDWTWRLRPDSLSADLCRSIRELAETYGRVFRDEEHDTAAQEAGHAIED